MKEIGCGLLASPPRYIATGPQTSPITIRLIKIAQCSLLLMGFIGTTITAQSKPPTSVKWSKLLVIYPFVSPCSRMQILLLLFLILIACFFFKIHFQEPLSQSTYSNYCWFEIYIYKLPVHVLFQYPYNINMALSCIQYF